MSQAVSSRDHAVQFYESHEYLIQAVFEYLANGFRNGNGMVIITTPDHRQSIKNYLKGQGFDVAATLRSGQLKEFDAHETLSAFMTGDQPNRDRFGATIGNVIDSCRAGRQHLPVLAYGDMVDVLWREGKGEAAIRLEELWNELAATHSFELFCAYCLNGFFRADHRAQFELICKTHSRVIPAEHYSDLNEEGRSLEITRLQQESLALRSEIEHRRQVERALLQALDERRRIEESLRKTEHRFRSLLENGAEALHWVGPDGCIIWANNAELELLGYSADEYIGHNIAEFHADPHVFTDMLRRLSAGETIKNYEAPLRAKDGSIRYVLVNSNVLREDGQFVHTQCFTRDVTELRHARQAEFFLSAIVDSAEDAVLSKTLDGIIMSWNPGAERIFGYSAEEVIGKPITILIPPDHQDEEPWILERLREGERIEHYETRRIRKDGAIIDISLTVSPIRDPLGRIIGASKIARDITLRKRLEAERNRLLEQEKAARREAEAVNRVKDEFLATLSHELRTPLNAILGWVSILESRKDENLVARAMDVIKRNVTVQKSMIEDLLDIARVLSGKMVIKSEPVNIRNIINAAVDSVTPAAIAKSVRVDREVPDQTPTIRGDADRLQQVIWNLLSNSIKFTPQNGYVHLRLSEVGSQVEITIRDTGKGIAPDFLPYVFERFRQGDASTTRQHGGLGLGLAVVRHLVEAHGGTVSADSAGEGRGATFTVRLPVLFASQARTLK